MDIQKDLPIEILRLMNSVGDKPLHQYIELVARLFNISEPKAIDIVFEMRNKGLIESRRVPETGASEIGLSSVGYEALANGQLRIQSTAYHDAFEAVMRDLRSSAHPSNLALMFPLDEFSSDEISEMMGSLNDMYHAISGDDLEIKRSGIVHGIYELQNA